MLTTDNFLYTMAFLWCCGKVVQKLLHFLSFNMGPMGGPDIHFEDEAIPFKDEVLDFFLHFPTK